MGTLHNKPGNKVAGRCRIGIRELVKGSLSLSRMDVSAKRSSNKTPSNTRAISKVERSRILKRRVWWFPALLRRDALDQDITSAYSTRTRGTSILNCKYFSTLFNQVWELEHRKFSLVFFLVSSLTAMDTFSPHSPRLVDWCKRNGERLFLDVSPFNPIGV